MRTSILGMSMIVASTLGALAGCKPYKLEPPAGFAEVETGDHISRMKASDDVGLSLRVFDNVKGGTLAYWSEDLVEKLGRRGYQLQAQSPTASRNGVAGTRFDFAYTAPTAEAEPKFYSVVLFASDKHRVVVQLAGDSGVADRHRKRLDEIAKSTVVRGCKPGSDICRGPQPGPLATVAPEKTPAGKDVAAR